MSAHTAKHSTGAKSPLTTITIKKECQDGVYGTVRSPFLARAFPVCSEAVCQRLQSPSSLGFRPHSSAEEAGEERPHKVLWLEGWQRQNQMKLCDSNTLPTPVLTKASPVQSVSFTSGQIPRKEQTKVLSDGFLMGMRRKENLNSVHRFLHCGNLPVIEKQLRYRQGFTLRF